MNEVDRVNINSAIDYIKRSGEHLISTLERSNSDGSLFESVKELQSQIMSNSNIVAPAVVACRLGLAVRTARAWAAGATIVRARRSAPAQKPGDVVRAIIAIATRLGSACRPASTFEPRKSAVNCRAAPLRCKLLSSSLRRRSRSATVECGRLPERIPHWAPQSGSCDSSPCISPCYQGVQCSETRFAGLVRHQEVRASEGGRGLPGSFEVLMS